MYFIFSLLCSNKAAKSVEQIIQNQRVSMCNHIILSANDNKLKVQELL